ncbi:MAG: serine O-acetyltransferase [Lachnospiraceae bacterium]|nr:serine O-acetyltransferase [Lachnospiraceae bacterium]MBP3595251.1 serine O-acetyltransferase [Lachnospiraceae bacterium]
MKYSFSIPANVFGAGLRINHICGGIIINPNCKIGDWCDIHQGVNIGQSIDGKCPEIGSNVYIGPGAKIFGNICIADDVMIGANAVVTKSIYEKGAVVGGVPAKLISVNEKNPLHRE